MELPNRFRRWFKTRFAVLYPFGFYLAFFSNSDDHSIMHGIWFIMAGLLIRLWANGYAIKMDRLTTCGPYAYLRHPLYLGTILLMLGFILMQRVYVVGAAFLSAFLFIYARTIQSEEGMLIVKFGQGYRNYRTTVPAIFPRFHAYRDGEKWPFSFERLLHSQEYKLFLWMIILVIGLHLKDELLIEHEVPDLKIWLLVIMALVMASSDFILDGFRKKKYAALPEKITAYLISSRKNILYLLVLSFVFFFLGNGIIGLSHPDEVFYAQTAKEMLQRHEWLVPYLFNGPNFEKPVLSYWLFMLAFSVFGVSSFSARFFPAVFALVGILAVYVIGKKGFQDERKGLYGALILMSSLLWVGLGRTVFTDMFFTVWIELSLISFYWAYLQPARKTVGLILFWTFAALAVLTKGILGVLVPLDIAIIFLILRKDFKFLMSPSFGLGFLLFLAVALPWYVYVIEKFGSLFIQEFFYNDHVRRLLEAEHKGNDRWFFYPFNIIGLMAPWCLFTMIAFINTLRRIQIKTRPFHLFLMVWIVVVFFVFQTAHSKLVSYIFPLFPALALLCSDYVSDVIDERKSRWMFLISGLIFPLAGIIGVIVAMTFFLKHIPPHVSLKPALCFFLLMAVGTWMALLKKDGALVRIAVLMVQIPALLTFAFMNHNAFERYVSSKEACEHLMRMDSSHSPILCSKLYLRSTRFFTDQDVLFLNINGGGRFFSPHPVQEIRSSNDILAILKKYPAIHGVLSKKDVKELERIKGQVIAVKVLAVVGDENLVEISLI